MPYALAALIAALNLPAATVEARRWLRTRRLGREAETWLQEQEPPQ